MKRCNLWGLGNQTRATVAVVALFFGLGWVPDHARGAQELKTGIDNNQPIRNPGGAAASYAGVARSRLSPGSGI